MGTNDFKYTQYFSKWRKCWITPKQEFTKGQIIELQKYKYELR